MLPKKPIIQKAVACLVLLLGGLNAHVTAQLKPQPVAPVFPGGGRAPEMPAVGVLTIRWDMTGKAKFNANCQLEEVVRAISAIARKKIRIESIPHVNSIIDYENVYREVDFLFEEIVLKNSMLDVATEGDVYIIRKKK